MSGRNIHFQSQLSFFRSSESLIKLFDGFGFDSLMPLRRQPRCYIGCIQCGITKRDMAKSDSLIKFSQLNRRLKCMNLLSALWLACLAISWYVQYFILRSNNRRLCGPMMPLSEYLESLIS
jgi:hypothetical protein